MKVPQKIAKCQTKVRCWSHQTLFMLNSLSEMQSLSVILFPIKVEITFNALKTWLSGKYYEKKQKCLHYTLQVSKQNNLPGKQQEWESCYKEAGFFFLLSFSPLQIIYTVSTSEQHIRTSLKVLQQSSNSHKSGLWATCQYFFQGSSK